ncbi:MAG: hypothetical protein GX629_07485 [Phycisphaerae bacterium]|nr:hypothetical protein [Phycisphaerae bacterium]
MKKTIVKTEKSIVKMEKSIDKFDKTIVKMEKSIDKFDKTIDKCKMSIEKRRKTIDKPLVLVDFLSFSTDFGLRQLMILISQRSSVPKTSADFNPKNQIPKPGACPPQFVGGIPRTIERYAFLKEKEHCQGVCRELHKM